MSVQSPFTFPLRGLGQGVHAYELVCDDAFFATFESSPVSRADIKMTLTVDRTPHGMTLSFDYAGSVATTCDRCMADIDLPIDDKRDLIVKMVANATEFEDEADLIFIDADANLFNAAPYAYEMILLSVPMIRTYACREGELPYPCDEEMLARIDESIERLSGEDDGPKKQSTDDDKPSPWDVLKDLQ